MLNWLIIIVVLLVVALTLGAAKKVAEISGLSLDMVILLGAAVVFYTLWKKTK